MTNFRNNFPKKLPELSADDKIIADDFMKLWEHKLDKKNIYNLF